MSRRARLAAGLLLMTSTVGALSTVAGAQAAGPAAGAAEAPAPDRLVVTDQDDWVPARGEFQLTVQVDAPDDDSVVQVRIYPPVDDPAAVRAGTLPTRSLRRAALEELDAGRQTVTLRMAVVPDADGTPGDPLVLDPGVYPLRVQLLDGDGNSVDEVVTHLVHLAPDAPAAERRPLALVVPLHAPPARDQSGRSVLPADTVAELDRRLATLAAYPEVPISVRATPETVNALAERQDGTSAAALARLVALTAAASESLAGTFVRMDESAWFRGGYTDLLANELDLGRETLEGAQLDPAAGAVALDSVPSANLTAWLGQRGVTRLVMPPATAPVADGPGSAATPAATPAPATPRPAAPAPLDGRPAMAVTVPLSLPSGDQVPDGPSAHRELAALAVDAIAEPAGPVQVVELAAAPTSDPAFLRTILEAVSHDGPFQPTTLSTAFDRAAAGSPPPLAMPDAPAAPLGDLTTTYLTGVNLLSSLIAMVGPQDPAIAPLQTRLLLVPAGDGPVAAPGQLVEDIHAAARAATTGLQLPTSGTIVVTSHDARLPLVLRNQSERTMHVALQLSSSELEFTGPNPLELTLPPGPTDIEIPIHTRRSGEFEVDIRATSPDGGLSLAETRLTVQSRAISGVGVLLSAGALVFLLIWWVRNYRNRARRRPAPVTPEPVADPVKADPDRTTVTAGPVP